MFNILKYCSKTSIDLFLNNTLCIVKTTSVEKAFGYFLN